MEIKNATTVHQIWKDLPTGDLLATFQYSGQADKFCEAVIEEQPENVTLIRVCHYTGETRLFRKAVVAKTEARSND